VVVCPPIYSRFFRGKTAYAVGKVGMSVMVKGLAMDWERQGEKGLGICGIWPAVVGHIWYILAVGKERLIVHRPSNPVPREG